MKTYIGKRLSTKSKLCYFYILESGETRGGETNPNVPIGTIISDDKGVSMHTSEEDIAQWTKKEIDAINEYRLIQAKAHLKKNTTNEVARFQKYLIGLNLTYYEKSEILNSIRESLKHTK